MGITTEKRPSCPSMTGRSGKFSQSAAECMDSILMPPEKPFSISSIQRTHGAMVSAVWRMVCRLAFSSPRRTEFPWPQRGTGTLRAHEIRIDSSPLGANFCTAVVADGGREGRTEDIRK